MNEIRIGSIVATKGYHPEYGQVKNIRLDSDGNALIDVLLLDDDSTTVYRFCEIRLTKGKEGK